MATKLENERVSLSNRIREQRAWIDKCGGSLGGYLQNYGSKNHPPYSGEGGEAIWAADKGELDRLEERLRLLDAEIKLRNERAKERAARAALKVQPAAKPVRKPRPRTDGLGRLLP